MAPAAHKAFAAAFGSLEVNVASGAFTAPQHPEVMILSNIVRDGRPIGLADAGQDWHTDMSYSRTVAFLNVLHGIEVPMRDGRPLGGEAGRQQRRRGQALVDEVDGRVQQQ